MTLVLFLEHIFVTISVCYSHGKCVPINVILTLWGESEWRKESAEWSSAFNWHPL